MPAKTNPLVISDLRGGLSDEHPAKLDLNQVAYAQNVDYWDGWLGGRRNGSSVAKTIGIPPHFLHRHTPTTTAANDTLWGLFDTGAGLFVYYDAAFSATAPSVSPADSFASSHASFASLHGKLFIAADTTAYRLHVYDGTLIRRTGMAPPLLGPAAVDTGVGSYADTRYFRVRYIEIITGVITRRSEPSPTSAFIPSGTGLSARLTRPALVGEGETHWEIEESINRGDWYRIARLAVGTTTYDDSLAAAAVASDENSILSEDIGDYALLPSARWLVVDDDRLIYAGNIEDPTLDARVGWTPLGTQVGVGNDERAPLDAGSYIDVDDRNGGLVTGLKAFDRKILVFKQSSINTLVRSSSRTRAYVLGPVISRVHGALPYSIAEGLDSSGNACVYFADSTQGLMRWGGNGLETISIQLIRLWTDLNRDSSFKVCEGVYHAEKGQFWLNVASSSSVAPNFRWVYDRFTGGVTFHTLPEAAYSMAMWDGKPHVGTATQIIRCDDQAATNDYGTAFRAYVRTRAYQAGKLLRRTATSGAVLEATPHSGVTLSLTLIRDYGMETRTVSVSLAPTAAETLAGVTNIIRLIDDGYLTEALTLQFEIGDAGAVSAPAWQLHQLVLNLIGEGKST